MTVSDFEDPRALLLCIQSDCERPRAGGSPFCAQHLREQEMKSPGIVEPEVEAKVARVRTEDDDHPGMVKVYDRETGEPSWVPAEPARLYVGPDPDVNGLMAVTDSIIREVSGNVPRPPKFDPDVMEPHWDGSQWVLRPKQRDVDLDAVRDLVRRLSTELGMADA